MTFSELKIIKSLVSALNDLNHHQATPIKQQAIPHILNGADIFGCAQTGTGKTAAFSAVSLCAAVELPYLKDINKLIRKNIEVMNSHPFT